MIFVSLSVLLDDLAIWLLDEVASSSIHHRVRACVLIRVKARQRRPSSVATITGPTVSTHIRTRLDAPTFVRAVIGHGEVRDTCM